MAEGASQHDTFKDFRELAWTMGKTVAGGCGGIDRAGHGRLKELESGIRRECEPGRGGGSLRKSM